MKHPPVPLPRPCAAALQVAIGLVISVAAPGSFAQVTVEELWSQTFKSDPGVLDRSVGVVVDHLGDVIVTGQLHDVDRFDRFMSDFYTVKYSGKDGSVLWQRRYREGLGGFEFPIALAVDDRGNVVVTGYGANAYTAKYAAADGAVLWEQYVWDVTIQLQAMALDRKGNVIVAGNGYVAKYAAANGSVLWEQLYGGAARAVAVDGHGDVAVTGEQASALTSYDYCTAKYSGKNGSLLWERIYNGPGNGQDNAAAVAMDGSGNVVVTGDSENADLTTNFKADYYTVKYASRDGRVVWEHRYNGDANLYDQARSIVVDRDDNVIVTGDSYASNFFPHFYTAKYASRDGTLLWGTYFTGVDNRGGEASAVAVDRSGSVIVTGMVLNGVPNGFYTAEYSGLDGTLRWERYFSGAGNWKQIQVPRQGLALGPDGVVAVSGSTSFQYNLDLDFATVLYQRETAAR